MIIFQQLPSHKQQKTVQLVTRLCHLSEHVFSSLKTAACQREKSPSLCDVYNIAARMVNISMITCKLQ